MSTVIMSIHRALGELKTYDNRIKNAICSQFVIANKKSNEKIGGKTVKEFTNAMKGNFNSVTSLIENKKRIKQAIVISNAETNVSISNVTYKVAEAIERKNLIRLEEEFLAQLKTQYKKERDKVENENNALQNKLEDYLKSVLGEKNNRTPEDVAKYTEDFEKRHKYDLIDPANIENYIKQLDKEIIDFKTEVDYVLSESNANTKISVDLVD
jgi:hypothetical protein